MSKSFSPAPPTSDRRPALTGLTVVYGAIGAVNVVLAVLLAALWPIVLACLAAGAAVLCARANTR